jgi:hypothetical protein
MSRVPDMYDQHWWFVHVTGNIVPEQSLELAGRVPNPYEMEMSSEPNSKA